jgi:hypothetical protein
MRHCLECKRIKICSFCVFCFKKTKNAYILKTKTEHFEVTFNRTKLTHKRPGVKKFLRQVIVGWMPSVNSKKHPRGVFVSRVIDREHDVYEEEIIDRKTGKVIMPKKEPLSQHKSKK